MWPRRLPVFLVRGVAYAGEVRITLSVEANARALATISFRRNRSWSSSHSAKAACTAFRQTSSPVIRQVSSRKLDAGRPTASASRYSVSRLGHFRPRSMRARYPWSICARSASWFCVSPASLRACRTCSPRAWRFLARSIITVDPACLWGRKEGPDGHRIYVHRTSRLGGSQFVTRRVNLLASLGYFWIGSLARLRQASRSFGALAVASMCLVLLSSGALALTPEDQAYVDQQDAATLLAAYAYTDQKADETLTAAKQYTDQQATETLDAAKAYTNQQAVTTLANANAYTDQKADETLTAANQYTNQQANATLSAAKAYTDQKADDTLTAANQYTDQQVAATLDAAKTYTDQQVTATLEQVAATLDAANEYADQQAAAALGNAKAYTDNAINEQLIPRVDQVVSDRAEAVMTQVAEQVIGEQLDETLANAKDYTDQKAEDRKSTRLNSSHVKI